MSKDFRDKNGHFASEEDDGKECRHKKSKQEKLADLERKYQQDDRETEKDTVSPDKKISGIKIDFTRDNILPHLNDRELKQLNISKSKPVLIKKSVIDRNKTIHPEITESDFEKIVSQALYKPLDVFRANEEKPYYHFVKRIEITSKKKPKMGFALIEISESKENFELVHAHYMEVDRFLKKFKKRKD